jgi:hypothetical protein
LLIIELKGIKDSIIDARDKGIKTHFITEITKDNISYCKALVMLTDEVSHLDGSKEVSGYESEYIAPAALHNISSIYSWFVQTNKEKLTTISSKEDNNSKESKEPDYDEDKDQLEESQEEETGEKATTNATFSSET